MSQPIDAAAPPGAFTGTGPVVHSRAGRSAWLFHPAVDFLCLGGGSLAVLLPVALLSSPASLPTVTAIAFLLADVINHPHFAHSYQIFYRGFRRKALGQGYKPLLRARYVFAGLIVPVGLASFLLTGLATADAHLLGLGGNLMLLLVGWHYVKQGYGMAVVDSVLKRQFFSEQEKKILLVNAYACWAASWMLANVTVIERELWGLRSYAVDLPKPLVTGALVCATATTAVMLYMLGRKMLSGSWRMPVNGVVAYLAAVYVWLFIRWLDPIVAFLVPAFHSLQYLVVVWRYQLNCEAAQAGGPRGGGTPARLFRAPLLRFVLAGVVLGYLGFWGVPQWLDTHVGYDRDALGGSAFLFSFWIFINVHHYFLDNVMWRRDNPDVRTHLFG